MNKKLIRKRKTEKKSPKSIHPPIKYWKTTKNN